MRGNAARAFLPALAVLALAAIVAVAAGGSTPGGTGDSRGPSELVLDTLLTLVLLLFVFAIATIVYAIFHRKELGNLRPPQRHRRSAVASLLIFFAILAIVALLRSRGAFPGDEQVERLPAAPMPPGGGDEPTDQAYDPQLAWLPLLVVGMLAAIAYGAFTVAARRRHGPRPRSAVAATLADILDDSLDDLRAEADPRRAVIAAYARLERVLAAHGLAKHSPETPQEYLARILPALEVDASAIGRLTDLFTWAKFSHHDVGPAMKEEAIAAFATARDDLRAAAARPEESAHGMVAIERPA